MNKINIKNVSDHHKYTLEGIDVYTPYEIYETQSTYMSYVIKCLKSGENALIQSPTGTGKTISLLSSTLAWLTHQQDYKITPASQIIYTSRTHAQLKQVISQLQKLCYQVKIAILSSRDHSCANQDLKMLKGQDKQFQCRLRITQKRGLSCQFYKNEAYFQKQTQLGKLLDIQQLTLKGKLEGFCPFYFSRHSRTVANIIFMPYSYLFDNKIWSEDDGVRLQNSIIIIDEAHNIQSVCEQSRQMSLNLNTLTRAMQQMEELRVQKLSENKNKLDPGQLDKVNMLKLNIEDIEINASYIQNLYEYMQTLDLPTDPAGLQYTVNSFFQNVIDKATQNSEFGPLTKNILELLKTFELFKSDLLFKPFWALESWMKFIQNINCMIKSYQKNKEKSEYVVQISYEGSDIKINIYCLDPGCGFQQIVRHKPKSIILTSGTLSPLKVWPLQLRVKFADPVSCPHILSKQQVNCLVLSSGHSGQKLSLTYQNRKNAALFEDIGNAIYQIIRNTRNGVVLFFTSYLMLETTRNTLTSMKLMTKIYEQKNVYFEKRDSLEFKSTIDMYMKDAQSQKGAVLFALIKGKISQGLDFSHKKCRAVVLIGVPYPSSKDIKVISKMKYLDCLQASGGERKNTFSGSQWYLSETIRSINQGIGRIIRNRQDYGTIYLLDYRFTKDQIKNQISSWAKACLVVIQSFNKFKDEVKRINGIASDLKMIPIESDLNFVSHKGTIVGPHIFSNAIKTVKGSISIKAPKTLADDIVHHKQENMTLEDMILEFKANRNLRNQKDQLKDKQKQDEELKIRAAMMEVSKKSYEEMIFNKNKKKTENSYPKVPLQPCQICQIPNKMKKSSICQHKMCQQCWQKWLKQDLRCPLCRTRVRQKFLVQQN